MDTKHDHDESAYTGGAGARPDDSAVVAHDESANTSGPSRPDDPAVVAAAAGKTTPERSDESSRQRQPSRRHNRGPPLEDDDDGLVGDLLVGAGPIEAYLRSLGVPNPNAFYLHRAGKLPIGKYGANLIASKRRLARHTQKITAPTA
jgi:hypothetical protein